MFLGSGGLGGTGSLDDICPWAMSFMVYLPSGFAGWRVFGLSGGILVWGGDLSLFSYLILCIVVYVGPDCVRALGIKIYDFFKKKRRKKTSYVSLYTNWYHVRKHSINLSRRGCSKVLMILSGGSLRSHLHRFHRFSNHIRIQVRAMASTSAVLNNERFLADRTTPLCGLDVAKSFALLRCVT